MKSSNYFFIVLYTLTILFSNELKAQLTHRVLFLGNSYTGVNNLPQIVHDVALSAGDTLIFDSNTPGGYQLVDHYLDSNSYNKVVSGTWDYLVLQGQSQEPITRATEFTSGGMALNNLLKQNNPCAVTLAYMTWGRKNGDAANCPLYSNMCTYEGMDSSLRNAYLNLASYINGEVSPVSIVWNYIRQNFPNIELYQSDESHPSIAGSYAAACSFYTTIFKKDPTLITFDFGLDPVDASTIRSVTKTQVFDHLNLWDLKKLPEAEIRYQAGSSLNEIIFNANSNNVNQTYDWDFGDGDTASIAFIPHSYLSDGTYTVSLTTTTCNLQGFNSSFTDTTIQICSHTPTIYTTHGWLCEFDTLWTQAADSYQWYLNGVSIPETNQFVADYYQYGSGSSFSVMTTLNTCSELSVTPSLNIPWSGYYFDGIGNPCTGDTVRFIVLNINGSLSGQETILWFKNDTLLASMTNEDTLLINSSGRFECKVIDPNSDCILDTTRYALQFDCGIIGIDENDQELFWTLFPNPATETINIKFATTPKDEAIEIYNAIGNLMKRITTSGLQTEIDIEDLSSGIYFVRSKNDRSKGLKFIKI